MIRPKYEDGMLVLPIKDPEERLDYTALWSSRELGTDYIVDCAVEIVEGTVLCPSVGVVTMPGEPPSQATTFWITGGEAGERAVIKLTVGTGIGRLLEQSFVMHVRQR